MTTPLASHAHGPGGLDATLTFLKRTRWEMRSLRFVRVWTDRLQIYDVNHDIFEVLGVGYPDADIVPILQAINTAFDPTKVHDAIDKEYKEYDTGRRHCWAEDRVM